MEYNVKQWLIYIHMLQRNKEVNSIWIHSNLCKFLLQDLGLFLLLSKLAVLVKSSGIIYSHLIHNNNEVVQKGMFSDGGLSFLFSLWQFQYWCASNIIPSITNSIFSNSFWSLFKSIHCKSIPFTTEIRNSMPQRCIKDN